MRRADFCTALMNGAAVCLGVAIPMLTMGRIVMLGLFVLGAVLGLASLVATRGREVGAFLVRQRLPIGLGLAFLIVALVSGALSEWRDATLAKAADLWLQGAVLTAALTFASLCPRPQARLLALSFVVSFAAAAFFVLGDSTNCLANAGKGDLYSWCVQRARHRGTAYAMLVPLAVGLLAAAATRPDCGRGIGWLLTVLVFVMALGVFMSGSRSGWIGMFAALTMLTAVAAFRGQAFGLWRALGAVAVAFGTYLTTVRIMAPQIMTARLQISDAQYGAFNGREAAWRAALELWQAHPILGTGPWSFRHAVEHFTHPHNFILELMSDTGTLGAGFIAMLLLLLVVRALRMTAAGPASTGAAAAVAAFFTASLAATSIFYGWWLCVLFGILTVGVAAHRVEMAEREAR